MGNRTAGLYDPGACHVEDGRKHEEASIALDWARDLRVALEERGHETMLTRSNETDPCPVWKRAAKAELWKADLLMSVHVNDADSDQAHGTEILYRKGSWVLLADEVLAAYAKVTQMRVRGLKIRTDLSVLNGSKGPAILLELGFIAHDGDRAKLLDASLRMRACAAMADAIGNWWKKGRK